MPHTLAPALARKLVLDELFDLTLYRRLQARAAPGPWRNLLTELVRIETGHLALWQNFFGLHVHELNTSRRFKLAVIDLFVRVFGEHAGHLVLESIEVYGIRKYLAVWKQYQGTPLAENIRGVLHDELDHEDAIIEAALGRKISGERIRNIFLGLNDGLVEMLGAVSGLFAALSSPSFVVLAGLTVAFAGAFSMAAGVFVSSGSEREVERTELRRQAFLAGQVADEQAGSTAWRQGVIVGAAYLFGAFVPLTPVLLGTRNVWASCIAAALILGAVSVILAFLSGMDIRRRLALNLLIGAAAVTVTFVVGTLTKSMFGVGM